MDSECLKCPWRWCCIQCQIFWAGVSALLLIPPPLHMPWLLRGIIPKQWVAGDWCSPKEQAEGAKQWDERLGGTGRCPRTSQRAEQGE